MSLTANRYTYRSLTSSLVSSSSLLLYSMKGWDDGLEGEDVLKIEKLNRDRQEVEIQDEIRFCVCTTGLNCIN